MTPQRQSIGLAVVESAGRFLVGIRPPGVPLAGSAEFPGGKCEPGETPAACAVRECREETGLVVAPVRPLLVTEWDHLHAAVQLHFWLCDLAAAASEPIPTPPFRWIPRDDLSGLPWPAANAVAIAQITRRSPAF